MLPMQMLILKKYRFGLMLGLSLIPIFSEAASPLVIPQSPEEMRKYMNSSGDARCPGCGVVTNIRQTAGRGALGQADEEAQQLRRGDPGPGEDIGTTTIIGSGAQSRDARKQSAKPASGPWLVTVRYDDGSYAAFEQSSKPSVGKGERVQVVSGRVERR
jgi:hypothetical protein